MGNYAMRVEESREVKCVPTTPVCKLHETVGAVMEYFVKH